MSKNFFLRGILLFTILSLSALFLIFLGSRRSTDCEKETLGSVWNAVKHLPEDVSSDNANWLDPDFSTFYQSRKPGVIERLLHQCEPMDIGQLCDCLNALTERQRIRKENVNSSKADIVQLHLKPTDSVVIWGDLHGALHSFKRTVFELLRRGLINEKMELAEGVYFVFIGDLINRSPYPLELLRFIVPFIERNENRVWYLKGNHERDAYWKDFLAMRYLIEHIKYPLVRTLNKFFNTLPDGLSLFMDGGDSTECIYVAHSNMFLPQLLKKYTVRVILNGERRAAKAQEFLQGLEFTGFDTDAAVWELLSCPTELYQRFMDFYFDSVVILRPAKRCVAATLTLLSHDIRKPDSVGFTEESWYAGYAIKVRPDGPPKEIVVGSTMSLAGGSSSTAVSVKDGLEAALMKENEENFIPGYFIRPLVLDDFHSARKARENIETLKKKYGTDIILIPQGTSALAGYLDLVKSGAVSVFFPRTGGAKFRDPLLQHLIHFRPSYDREIELLINFIVDTYQVKKFAFVYQKDSFGKPLLEAAHRTLEKRGIKDWLDIRYLQNPEAFKKEIEKLVISDVEAVGVFLSLNSAIRDFLVAVGPAFFVGRYPFGLSFIEDEIFRNFIERQGIVFTVSYATPNPFDFSNPLVRECHTALKRYGIALDSNSMEGYIAGTLMARALKYIGEPFTSERILKFFEECEGYEFYGNKLTFDEKTRSLNFPILIRSVDNEWKEFPV